MKSSRKEIEFSRDVFSAYNLSHMGKATKYWERVLGSDQMTKETVHFEWLKTNHSRNAASRHLNASPPQCNESSSGHAQDG